MLSDKNKQIIYEGTFEITTITMKSVHLWNHTFSVGGGGCWCGREREAEGECGRKTKGGGGFVIYLFTIETVQKSHKTIMWSLILLFTPFISISRYWKKKKDISLLWKHRWTFKENNFDLQPIRFIPCLIKPRRVFELFIDSEVTWVTLTRKKDHTKITQGESESIIHFFSFFYWSEGSTYKL